MKGPNSYLRRFWGFLVALLLLATFSDAVPTGIKPSPAAHSSSRLDKRGCFMSKEDVEVVDAAGAVTLTTVQVPICNELSVARQKEQIIAAGQMTGDKTCLFYLNLGRQNGETLAQQWYCANMPDGAAWISWSPLINTRARDQIYSQLDRTPDVPNPRDLTTTTTAYDVWGALLSQAMADMCQGDVYFFTPDGQDWQDPTTNTWYQFEYPSLTRNSNITTIYQVDPSKNADGDWVQTQGTPVWTQGDGYSDNTPAGDGYDYVLTSDNTWTAA